MRPHNRIGRICIGIKLGFCLVVSMALVTGMIVSEHISSSFVESLVAAANEQRIIVSESLNTEALIQRAQIAGRGLRVAQSPAQVEMLLAELQQITGEADEVAIRPALAPTTYCSRKRLAVAEVGEPGDGPARLGLRRRCGP